jgi:triphosphoribosyl-dephospho-CoA synthetase
MTKYKTIIRSLLALAVALPAAMAMAQTQYPEVTRAQTVGSVVRPCTQLEISADISAENCGTMTLSEVVMALHKANDD